MKGTALVNYLSGLVLAEDEIVELTGRKRSSAQRQVLDHMGLKYLVRPDGSLAVSRAYFESMFEDENQAKSARKVIEPNWDEA